MPCAMDGCIGVLVDGRLDLFVHSRIHQGVEGLEKASVYFGVPTERARGRGDVHIGQIVV